MKKVLNNYDKALEITYKDLCEYYDYVKKNEKGTDRWLIISVINKNKNLIIDDLSKTHPKLEFNKGIFNKALKKLNKKYDTSYDINHIINSISSGNSSSSNKKDTSLEDEMNAYNLDDEEKELVRKNEYDSWDFEYPSDHPNEDMDDDDYYEDDDL